MLTFLAYAGLSLLIPLEIWLFLAAKREGARCAKIQAANTYTEPTDWMPKS